MSDYKAILEFWFDGLDDLSILDTNSSQVKKWFIKDEVFDLEIKNRFEGDLNKAKNGKCSAWEETLDGRLALIILFDQFSRNIYRNTLGMFENDFLALNLSLQMIESVADIKFSLIKRAFIYLPLMHSEDVKTQEISVGCYENLLKDAYKISPKNISYFQNTLDFAKKHFNIVRDFGRFPHRNVILGRVSTEKEEGFLRQPGSSF